MNDQEVTSEEINYMVETMDAFSKMVKDTMLISKTNADVQLAMKCARKVESIFKALKDERLHFLFIQHMCKTLHKEEDSYDVSTMQYACDTILEAIVTNSTVLSSCVLCGVNNYIELCGKDRFTNFMSAVIVKSEACRVLLDFIGTLENDSETSIIFQANLLLRILNEDEASVISTVYNWLNSNEENRIHVAFQAITEAGLRCDISKNLIAGLVSVLDDRKEAAVLYWSTVTSSPLSIPLLKESRSLFYASVDFLAKCGEKFEQTPQFTWVSHENGPCQVITFQMIVKYIQFLKSSDGTLATLIDTFISERCALPGCTLWEDIIDSFSI